MKKLIEALQILVKYKDEPYPTHCEHDVLMIMGITQEEVSEDDKAKLIELGFHWNNEHGCWASYKYGSA